MRSRLEPRRRVCARSIASSLSVDRSVPEEAICRPCPSYRPMITRIQISPETRERLSALKSSPRETYDELLNKLLSLVPHRDEEESYTDLFLVGLLNARLDIQARRLTSHDRVKKRLGL